MKYLIQEYHDGLLLYEVSNRDVWEKAANDEAGLQEFFNKNKSNYKWDAPRFKGIAYYTRDEKDIKAVQKSVKGKSFDKWVEILRTTFNNDSILRIRVEKGIFKQGDNKIVDKNEFKDANAQIRKVKDFPYTATFGKIIKKPEEMGDVRALVTADYQEMKEQEWLEELKKRYPAVINEDVLNTIK
jgi:peptidyl-prolyl cis-trans isomerase SurA